MNLSDVIVDNCRETMINMSVPHVCGYIGGRTDGRMGSYNYIPSLIYTDMCVHTYIHTHMCAYINMNLYIYI